MASAFTSQPFSPRSVTKATGFVAVAVEPLVHGARGGALTGDMNTEPLALFEFLDSSILQSLRAHHDGAVDATRGFWPDQATLPLEDPRQAELQRCCWEGVNESLPAATKTRTLEIALPPHLQPASPTTTRAHFALQIVHPDIGTAGVTDALLLKIIGVPLVQEATTPTAATAYWHSVTAAVAHIHAALQRALLFFNSAQRRRADTPWSEEEIRFTVCQFGATREELVQHQPRMHTSIATNTFVALPVTLLAVGTDGPAHAFSYPHIQAKREAQLRKKRAAADESLRMQVATVLHERRTKVAKVAAALPPSEAQAGETAAAPRTSLGPAPGTAAQWTAVEAAFTMAHMLGASARPPPVA
jgi:hypothetical protein